MKHRSPSVCAPGSNQLRTEKVERSAEDTSFPMGNTTYGILRQLLRILLFTSYLLGSILVY